MQLSFIKPTIEGSQFVSLPGSGGFSPTPGSVTSGGGGLTVGNLLGTTQNPNFPGYTGIRSDVTLPQYVSSNPNMPGALTLSGGGGISDTAFGNSSIAGRPQVAEYSQAGTFTLAGGYGADSTDAALPDAAGRTPFAGAGASNIDNTTFGAPSGGASLFTGNGVPTTPAGIADEGTLTPAGGATMTDPTNPNLSVGSSDATNPYGFGANSQAGSPSSVGSSDTGSFSTVFYMDEVARAIANQEAPATAQAGKAIASATTESGKVQAQATTSAAQTLASQSKADTTVAADSFKDYFGRAVVIVLGCLFVAAGLGIFVFGKNPLPAMLPVHA